MVLKVMYFDQPGRGEGTRIMLAYGNIPFEDVNVTHDTWPALKATTPLGQVPVLILEDGRMLAQSGAMERYAAKLSGLYPADPLVAAFADQASFLIGEFIDVIMPTFFMKGEEQIKAREVLLTGKLHDKFELVIKCLGANPFLAGAEISFADIQAFALLGSLKTGELPGFPTTMLDPYPTLKAYYQRIASVPTIKARYENATGARLSYKPE